MRCLSRALGLAHEVHALPSLLVRNFLQQYRTTCRTSLDLDLVLHLQYLYSVVLGSQVGNFHEGSVCVSSTSWFAQLLLVIRWPPQLLLLVPQFLTKTRLVKPNLHLFHSSFISTD